MRMVKSSCEQHDAVVVPTVHLGPVALKGPSGHLPVTGIITSAGQLSNRHRASRCRYSSI